MSITVTGGGILQRRLMAKIQRLDPASTEAKAALFRIGNQIVGLAMDNLTRQGAVDRGVLRASIKQRVETSGEIGTVLVAAFGVRYARMVEYGGAFTPAMRRAMFAAMRAQGRGPRPGKGIIQGNRYRARPFLGPAIRQARQFVIDEVGNLIKKGGSA